MSEPVGQLMWSKLVPNVLLGIPTGFPLACIPMCCLQAAALPPLLAQNPTRLPGFKPPLCLPMHLLIMHPRDSLGEQHTNSHPGYHGMMSMVCQHQVLLPQSVVDPALKHPSTMLKGV